eukprot:TRINITY_DN884_c0_g1_i1.p1 TRINITY_DN884_c0_g1~~TRINITY_DN884_c0_g1_i1.p1  ORF type:complete len:190 (+),score=59.75 TRINITY_DN884_c0_g1_i1:112-681(+)
MSLYTVKSILILGPEGERVVSKYYSDEYPTTKEQLAFEKSLYAKTSKINTEIAMWENLNVVYRWGNDVIFYVIGSSQENELLLTSVLNALYDALGKLFSTSNINQMGEGSATSGPQPIDRRSLLENLDYVLLALDELIDNGIILEADPIVIAQRVSMKGADSDIPLSEQTISQALQSAKEQIARSLLKS